MSATEKQRCDWWRVVEKNISAVKVAYHALEPQPYSRDNNTVIEPKTRQLTGATRATHSTSSYNKSVHCLSNYIRDTVGGGVGVVRPFFMLYCIPYTFSASVTHDRTLDQQGSNSMSKHGKHYTL